MDDLDALKTETLNAIAAAGDRAQVEDIRVGVLGRKGRITEMMKTLGALSPEDRKARGQAFNVLKERIVDALEKRKAALEASELEFRLEVEGIDVPLPPRPAARGRIHPVTQVIDEINRSITEINDLATESANRSRDIDGISESLEGYARELESQTGRFRV